MTSHITRRAVASIGALTLVLGVAACGSGKNDSASTPATTPPTSAVETGASTPETSGEAPTSEPGTGGETTSPETGGGTTPAAGVVKIGTTDKVVALDPAGSYDNGSLLLEIQLYQFLMSVPIGEKTPQPDAAEKCDFATPTTYTCTIKDGLTFSNGDPLTSEDVRFSFQRVLDIADPNGPSSLLANLDKVEAPDAKTVTFTLKTGNDQTFPFVLGTSAGPIVDSKVFPKDALLSDEAVIGSGPYKLGNYQKNQLAELTAREGYIGNAGQVKNSSAIVQYFTEASNLKLAIENGDVDVAWRSLDTQSIDDLKTNPAVQVKEGPGGEIRYIVFNLKTQPGDTEEGKRAVRRAVAYTVDRQAIADKIYKGTYSPLYSMVPDGLPGHLDALKTEFGDAPDAAKAKSELEAAGVATPVALSLQYSPDHYGPSSDQEYNEIKRQLEDTGLFKVSLQATEWVQYSKDRTSDVYPAYQLGWFPDFPDADNYLSPFLVEGNFLGAHYCDKGATDRPCDTDGVLPLLKTEQTESGDARVKAIEEIQTATTKGTLPTVPLLQGKQIAIVKTGVTGVEDTLDASFLFRFWAIGAAS
ncbi:peptide ABC transporter substrate-binding protein [Nakamurella silvestris]|nr:peptide ABC transporter substrate-binding protein [Nakamurella silvestris]